MQTRTMKTLMCCLGLICGCRYDAAAGSKSEVDQTRSQQLLFTVLNAALNGTGWLYDEHQKVAFADLPPEFKAAYDTSEFRDERGEEAEKATETDVIRYDIDQDGAVEYFVFDGFCGTSDSGWIIFTQKDKKWVKIGEEYGELKKMTHPKEKGLIISNRNGYNFRSFYYYELEKGTLVMKLKLEITYDHPEEGCPLGEKTVDLKITYQYSKGEVPHKDAVVRLRKAAKQGDALAQNVLGRCYSLQGNVEEKELMPCVNLVAEAIRREWDKEVFKWRPGLQTIQVELQLEPGGVVQGFLIRRGSGDAEVDRTARRALSRLRKIPGLSASFVQQFPTLPIAMDPVAPVGE